MNNYFLSKLTLSDYVPFKDFVEQYCNFKLDKHAEFYQKGINDFENFVNKLNASELDPIDGWPRTFSFWLRTAKQDILGGFRIRLVTTNSDLYKYGHIGYDISPRHRGKGLGYVILKLGILEAKKLNLKELTAIVNKNNIQSIRILDKLSNLEIYSNSNLNLSDRCFVITID